MNTSSLKKEWERVLVKLIKDLVKQIMNISQIMTVENLKYSEIPWHEGVNINHMLLLNGLKI